MPFGTIITEGEPLKQADEQVTDKLNEDFESLEPPCEQKPSLVTEQSHNVSLLPVTTEHNLSTNLPS